MDKCANNQVYSTVDLPFLGMELNNRRFMTALLAGVLGGAGVSSAAALLRRYTELRKTKKDETDDEKIVLTLPRKIAADGYDGMAAAKPGESKVTTDGSRQFRESGRFGKKVSDSGKKEKEAVKCAQERGNPGRNSVGTIVFNTLGMTAGGLLAYEAVSRLVDRLNERRLKRQLEAAQQAYVNAMSGASKRAEAVLQVLAPAEKAILSAPLEKEAWSLVPEAFKDGYRYPVAFYLLSLLAGTGATAYVTKKVMDREFPEEKLKKDINRPTRIVFRASDDSSDLLEGEAGQEKTASDETCAALTAILPIYMDVVEGKPNRTLADPYVKFAESVGTDPAGLMKMAQGNFGQMFWHLLRDPKALWNILVGTRFGLDFSKQKAVNILRTSHPQTYRRIVDAGISDRFASNPWDSRWTKFKNATKKTFAQGVSNFGGRDMMVDYAMKNAGDISSLLTNDRVRGAFKKEPDDPAGAETQTLDEKAIIAKAKKSLGARRRVSIEAADPRAADYVRRHRSELRRLLLRLNSQGSL